MIRRMAALVMALVLVVAACGDDDGGSAPTDGVGLDGAEQAIAGAIAAGMMGSGDPSDPFAQPEAAQCISEGVVGYLGVERLAEIGITSATDDALEAFEVLADDEIGDIADLALECIDLEEELASQLAADGLSRESALCMGRAFAETDLFRQAFIAGFTGDDSYDPSEDPEFLTTMIGAATECLTDEELSLIMGG